MSKISIKGAETGTGVFTLESPATNTDRTLVLPDEAGTVLTDRVIGVNASAPDDSVVVDASGNVGVGTTSPAVPLHVYNDNAHLRLQDTVDGVTAAPHIQFWDSNSQMSAIGHLSGSNNDLDIYQADSANIDFWTDTTLRARIDASGNFFVGTTTTPNSSNGGTRIGSVLAHSRVTTSAVAQFYGSTGENRFLGTGAMQNTLNSYGAISDIKLKENVTDATPKLEKLNQVRVVNYNLIGHNTKQIGVIAQELEQIFPGMVEETPDEDSDGSDLGTTTKSVKYSVFVPMLIKAMQEQQAIINTQAQTIESLTARVSALEAA